LRCHGPKESPNTSSLANQFEEMGAGNSEILRSFRNFNAYADAFRKESEAYEK